MNIENLINNTKPVADSFVNDQLKWRRERIEKLTQERDNYKRLYQNECEFVKQLTELIQFMTTTLEKDMGEIPNARKLMETIQEHVNNQKK
jgi:hypothetical protein